MLACAIITRCFLDHKRIQRPIHTHNIQYQYCTLVVGQYFSIVETSELYDFLFIRSQLVPCILPERRSAFTYWEEDIPRRIDLGKSKYGGPFLKRWKILRHSFVFFSFFCHWLGFICRPWILLAKSVITVSLIHFSS